MNGAKVASIITDDAKVNMNQNTKALVVEDKAEHISKAHCNQHEPNDNGILLSTIHPNKNAVIKCRRQVDPIRELINIARKTNQMSKVMNFPPIGTDS